MLRLRSRRCRLNPTLEALEDRTLAAIGQISLSFSPVLGLASSTTVQGTLPDVNKSVDVLAYSFNTANPTTFSTTTGGAGAGKVAFGALTITAAVGPQSAPLYLVETSGSHFSSAQMIVRNSAAMQVAVYDFATVFPTSISTSFATGGSAPTETYTFLYGALRETSYDPVSLRVLNVATWSQIQNTSTFTPALATINTFSTDATAGAAPGPADISVLSTAADASSSSAATKVTLHSHRQSGPGGPTITYTASVTSAAGVPTGRVTFYAQSTRLGDAPVAADGTATLTVAASAVGRALPTRSTVAAPIRPSNPAPASPMAPRSAASFAPAWAVR